MAPGQPPEDEHHGAQLVFGVIDHPRLDLVTEDDHEGGQRQRNQGDGHKEHGPKPAPPKAPILGREPVGAAKALHQRQHHAQTGKDAEAGGGQDHLAGVDATGKDVRLKQVHGVGGQKLAESGADFAHKCVSLRYLGQQRGDHQESGKHHEHAGIGHSLGRVDHVVGNGLPYSIPELGKKPDHALHWQE
jgi:hypothetical protein